MPVVARQSLADFINMPNSPGDLQTVDNNPRQLSSSDILMQQNTIKSNAVTVNGDDELINQAINTQASSLTKIDNTDDLIVPYDTQQLTGGIAYSNSITQQNNITVADRIPGAQSTSTSINANSETQDAGNQEEQQRILLVDKIIGLLKSEVINTNATADAGKHKPLTNRHSRPIKNRTMSTSLNQSLKIFSLR